MYNRNWIFKYVDYDGEYWYKYIQDTLLKEKSYHN